PAKSYLAIRRGEDQITLLIHCGVAALETQPQGLRPDARREDEIVFQLLLIPVVNKIYAGANILKLHLLISRNMRAPAAGVIANKIVTDPWQAVDTACGRREISFLDSHFQHAIGRSWRLSRLFGGPRILA